MDVHVQPRGAVAPGGFLIQQTLHHRLHTRFVQAAETVGVQKSSVGVRLLAIISKTQPLPTWQLRRLGLTESALRGSTSGHPFGLAVVPGLGRLASSTRTCQVGRHDRYPVLSALRADALGNGRPPTISAPPRFGFGDVEHEAERTKTVAASNGSVSIYIVKLPTSWLTHPSFVATRLRT